MQRGSPARRLQRAIPTVQNDRGKSQALVPVGNVLVFDRFCLIFAQYDVM